MGHVFISYAHDDQAFVDRLRAALSAHNVNTWVDRFQLSPGVNWTNEIGKALEEADAILFVISPNSARSTWVNYELQAAAQRMRTGSGKLVIPVLIGAPSEVPTVLQSIQWIDFSRDFEAGVEVLLQVLPSSVRQQQPPTVSAEKSKGFFFLSFVEEDSEFVAGLRQFMRDQKYGFWDFQESERDYGLQFWREIEEQIDKSAALLSILSPHWLLSKWAPREFLYAEATQKSTILLMSRPTKPSLLTVGMTYIDFTMDTKKGFSKLEKELRRKRL